MYSRPEEKRNFAFIIATVVSATTEVTAAGLVYNSRLNLTYCSIIPDSLITNAKLRVIRVGGRRGTVIRRNDVCLPFPIDSWPFGMAG